jgi:hypothetical protein
MDKKQKREQEKLTREKILQHIGNVNLKISQIIQHLYIRAKNHDLSKLEEPEFSGFVEMNGSLSATEYMSEDYQKHLRETVIAEHWRNNRHHPEYHSAGINDMNLIDLIEMFCDWKVASDATKGRSLQQSILVNTSRFNISPQLAKILENTRKDLGW